MTSKIGLVLVAASLLLLVLFVASFCEASCAVTPPPPQTTGERKPGVPKVVLEAPGGLEMKKKMINRRGTVCDFDDDCFFFHALR